jgi:hypothetical protein
MNAYAAAPQSAFVADSTAATKPVCEQAQSALSDTSKITSAPARYRWQSPLGGMIVCDYSGGSLADGTAASQSGQVVVVEEKTGMPLYLSIDDRKIVDLDGNASISVP